MKLPWLLEDPQQRAPLEERVLAARTLGALDPRPGQFCRVPAGTFLLGSEKGEPRERPLREARTAAFEIGLLPVTVAQFARFVPQGYRDRALWSEAGWAWRCAEEIERPRFWDEEAWSAYLAPSQPVVGVSWHEAQAYARFAGARLPAEDEWERAARGEDGRNFPWGEEWQAGNAHHRGGTRCTLPVGCFPAGRSPHGLLDASGNVWEWTSDSFSESDGDGASGSSRPVRFADRGTALLRSARGGGWNAHPAQLRCANRNAWPERARFSNLGFRLAR